jgi:hypothetical protein
METCGMRIPDWCYVDDLQPGDHLYDFPGDDEIEVVAYTLVRVPAGRCEWHVRTTGRTVRYGAMDQVPRVAA